MNTQITSTSPSRERKGLSIRRWIQGPHPIALIFFVGTLLLNILNTDLPFYYEKDASSKTHQVVTGERNFFHPLLMLNTADVILTLSGAERSQQNAVISGRIGNAIFTSFSVTFFVILGWRIAGRHGAISIGTLISTLPLLFELTHVFKEDPALLFGLSLSFLSMHIFWRKRGIYQTAWMGACTAIATSGKYVGVVTVILAAILLSLLWRKSGNRERWCAFLLGFFLAFSLINYQVFNKDSGFSFGFKTEISNLSRQDKLDNIPQFSTVASELKKAIPPLVAVGYASLIFHTIIFRRRDPIRWMLIAYPLVVIFCLLFSTRIFTRYFLPVAAILNIAAVIGISAVAQELARYRTYPKWIPSVACCIFVLSIFLWNHLPRLQKQYLIFAEPTRETFIEEAIYQLPKSAIIAAETRVFLVDTKGNPREHLPVQQKVITAPDLSRFGNLNNLRNLGITHIAIHGSKEIEERGKKKKARQPKKVNAGESIASGESIYKEILSNCKLIYYIKGRGSAYFAPALRLYEIPKPAVESDPLN